MPSEFVLKVNLDRMFQFVELHPICLKWDQFAKTKTQDADWLFDGHSGQKGVFSYENCMQLIRWLFLPFPSHLREKISS